MNCGGRQLPISVLILLVVLVGSALAPLPVAGQGGDTAVSSAMKVVLLGTGSGPPVDLRRLPARGRRRFRVSLTSSVY